MFSYWIFVSPEEYQLCQDYDLTTTVETDAPEIEDLGKRKIKKKSFPDHIQGMLRDNMQKYHIVLNSKLPT